MHGRQRHFFVFFTRKPVETCLFSVRKKKIITNGQDFYPGVGGAPLYKLYRCLPPHREGFLRRFGLKTGINFAHFGLESGMVFEVTTRVYERIYRFNSK